DPARKDELAIFASNLFGEDFPDGERAVIVSNRELHPALREERTAGGLSAADWIALGRIVKELQESGETDGDRAVNHWNREVTAAGLLPLALSEEKSLGDGLVELLGSNSEVRAAAKIMADKGSVPFEVLADQLFPRTTVADQRAACA